MKTHTTYAEVLSAMGEVFARIAKSQRTLSGSPLSIDVSATGGNTARVDWQPPAVPGAMVYVTLCLPSLPPATVLTRAEADRMVAFALHELQHVRKSVQGALGAFQGTMRDLVNALEDVVIERDCISEGNVPGAHECFSELGEHMLRQALAHGWKARQMADLPFLIALLGRAHAGHDMPSAALLKTPANLASAVSTALAGLPACHNTADNIALAKRILAAAQNGQTGAPQGKGEGEGEGKGKGEDTSGDPAKGKGEAKGEDAEGEDAEGEDAEGEDAEGDAGKGDGAEGDGAEGDGAEGDGAEGDAGEGKGKSPAKAKGDTGEGDAAADAGEGDGEGNAGEDAEGDAGEGGNGAGGKARSPEITLQDTVDAIAERIGQSPQALAQSRHLSHLSSWHHPVVQPLPPSAYGGSGMVGKYRGLMKNGTVLKDKVRRLLRSTDDVAVHHHQASGRLDRLGLARAMTGAPAVFTRRTVTEAINTAVALCLDSSGSMQGAKINHAKCMAIHLSEACKAAGAAVYVSTFTDNDGTAQRLDPKATALLYCLKDWHESTAKGSERIAMLGTPFGSPISDGIMGTVDVIVKRNATQRIVMSLTDGIDNCGPKAISWACDYARSKGVKVIGLGLGVDARRAGFPMGITINNPSDLASKALDVLARELVAGRT